MTTETLIFIILAAIVIVFLPAWSYSKSWGLVPGVIMIMILSVFVAWAFTNGRPIISNALAAAQSTVQDGNSGGANTMDQLKSEAQNALESVRQAGRIAADYLRNAVQGNDVNSAP